MHFHVFNVYCLHKRHSHSFSCSVIRFTSSAKPFTPCHSHITIYTRKKAGLVSFLEWTQFSLFLLVGKGGEYVQYVGCFLFIVECNRSIACGHHTLITSSPPPMVMTWSNEHHYKTCGRPFCTSEKLSAVDRFSEVFDSIEKAICHLLPTCFSPVNAAPPLCNSMNRSISVAVLPAERNREYNSCCNASKL